MSTALAITAPHAARADLRLVEATREHQVCPPDHAHAGSCSCYIRHGCRCEACRAENTQRNRRYRRLRAYGRSGDLVAMAPVREHLLQLIDAGMGYSQIAHVAGVAVTGVRVAIYGRRDTGARYGEIPRRIERRKAERLLAVTHDVRNLAGGTRISAGGSARRLQALMCLGWGPLQLADRLEMSRANLSRLMAAEHVTVRTHLKVKAVYDQWWNQLPPREAGSTGSAVEATRQMARERGWVSPLGWDDIDTDVAPIACDLVDDGDFDEIAVELAVAGDPIRLTQSEFDEAIRRLHHRQLSDGAIAARLHVVARTVLRARKRLQLPAAMGADGLPVAV